MNAYNETLKCIQWILDNRTSYRIAKDLGFSNRTVNRYQNKSADIKNMSLALAEKLYNYGLKEIAKEETERE